MELFINDLSLHQQFPAPAAFRAALRELLRCRECAGMFGRACYVPRTIADRKVTSEQSFRQVVSGLGDMNLIRLVMGWIDRHGPFADDALTRSADEYYWHRDKDDLVTTEVLGEVAARRFAERPVALVSVAPSDYTAAQLTVTWEHSDRPAETCEIENFCEQPSLHQFLKLHQDEIRSWPELLARVRAHFTNLIFLDDMEQYLAGEPFSDTIARRAMELLGILNRLKGCYTPDGRRTPEGEQLIENYFRRSNAAFTDASETERNDPIHRAAMTFRHPDGTPLECFGHGKISHRYFRIHHSLIEPHQPLYVAYIGPKLTKQ